MGSMRPPLAAPLIGALAACAMTAGAARGQAIDPLKAQDWLERSFGIKSEKVVDATPDALVVLKTIEPRPPSDFHVIAHLENFSPADPLTPPSSEQEYFINCPSRRFHVDRIESFSQNGARGAQSTSFGPTTWGKPIPNSTEERIVSAVCGPVVAQAQAEPSQPLPPPVTPPRPAAAARPIPKPVPLPPPRAASKPQPPQLALPRPTGSGPARAQLFASPDRAAAERLAKGLPARLPGLPTPEIVEATLGGRPIYRVQIPGFASQADAARFCAAARTAGQDCFVPPLAN